MNTNRLRFSQPIEQLDKSKGGYFILRIDSDVVNKFYNKHATRIICTIDDTVSIPCGFNHTGDGNFYLIVASRYLKQLKKQHGDLVNFEIYDDPNPLGVDIPEVLQVLLDQDDEAQDTFNKLTDGRKRTLIHSINRVKNIDKQVEKILTFLGEEKIKQLNKLKKA